MNTPQTDLCPHCGERGSIYQHRGYPLCTRCGRTKQDGAWSLTCSGCGEEADLLLSAPFVPTLCPACMDKALKEDEASGRMCALCGSARTVCTC